MYFKTKQATRSAAQSCACFAGTPPAKHEVRLFDLERWMRFFLIGKVRYPFVDFSDRMESFLLGYVPRLCLLGTCWGILSNRSLMRMFDIREAPNVINVVSSKYTVCSLRIRLQLLALTLTPTLP